MRDDCAGDCCLQVRVSEAPAMGGTKMYQVKVSAKGSSTSAYKTKDDLKSVIHMFRLVGAMARNKSEDSVCEVCAACSPMANLRTCDEQSLRDFLLRVLCELRRRQPHELQQCSTRKGVVQILMDFLGVRDSRYFSSSYNDVAEKSKSLDAAVQMVGKGTNVSDPAVQDMDEHPVSHCSLNRSLSKQFAAFDSVC